MFSVYQPEFRGVVFITAHVDKMIKIEVLLCAAHEHISGPGKSFWELYQVNFWNGSQAIPLQRGVVFTKIIIP